MANERIYSWRIAKATPSTPRLSTYSLGTLKNNGSTATFTVTRSGDGAILPTASPSGAVSLSVSGTTVTVTAISGGTVGSIKITVRIGEGKNYLAYDGDDVVCSLTVESVVPEPYTTLELTTARYNHAGGSVGNYVVVGGGYNSDGYVASVEAVNSSTVTKSSATSLHSARSLLAAANAGNYLVFAGGTTGSVTSATDAYGKDLGRMSTNVISSARSNIASASLEDYALFVGGYNPPYFSGKVDIFYPTLTNSTLTSVTAFGYGAGSYIDECAIVAGGWTSDSTSSTNTSNVIAFVTNGTTISTSSPSNKLRLARRVLSAANNGKLVVFAGGIGTSTSYSSYVDAYDSKLTRTTTNLTNGKAYLTGTRIGEYAAFSGGQRSSSATSVVNTVEIINTSLTVKLLSSLSTARTQLASGAAGNIMAVLGGADSSVAATKTIDVYKLE